LSRKGKANLDETPDATGDRLATPVEELQVTVEGVRWRYLHAGSGPPLVLLHGLLGYSFSWRYALPVWAQQASVFAADLPGAGFSDRPAGMDCSLRACADRLIKFLDAVGIATCDLLGTSHGGGVAMMAAALAPSRIRRLILVAPINPWSPRGRFLSIFLSTRPIAPAFLKLAPVLPAMHEFYFRRMFGDPRHIRPGTLEGYRKPLQLPGTFDYGVRILRTWNRDLKELKSSLRQIADIPALLVWGDLDGAVYPSSASRLAQEFRDCQLRILIGIGHLPYEEAPEEFNRTVSEFLSKARSSTFAST